MESCIALAEGCQEQEHERDLLLCCQEQSIALLKRNLTPGGILAATPGEKADSRSYTRVFGRDAAICVLAMVGSGDPQLEEGAIASLDSLARGQASNGQIPKFVDPFGGEADFWYNGCADATIWWLIAVRHARDHHPDLHLRWSSEVSAALRWLQAQEHPTFGLIQQNEASDWADIMPRSGYVLYTNALWYSVKSMYHLPNAEATADYFNHLFNPHQFPLPDYRRARLLSHYARRGTRSSGLYLSYVNMSSHGAEGDVLGNLLAVLYGPSPWRMQESILSTLEPVMTGSRYPGRSVVTPIEKTDPLWRAYMGRHQQNLPHQYHNGGIWPYIGGFFVMALAELDRTDLALSELHKLAAANAAHGWRFTEWFNGKTLQPCGMPGQTWNAATYLLAHRACKKTIG